MSALRLGMALTVLGTLAVIAGLMCGSDGCHTGEAGPIISPLITDIRLPRTLGAWLTGAALGLAGAIAQGLFRNPLADPYLLGSASGAHLGVTAALTATVWLNAEPLDPGTAGAGVQAALATAGVATAAFVGAVAATALTLLLGAGGRRPVVLLLAGVVVGLLLGALSELISLFAPQALRARQAFALGSTSLIDWQGVAALAAGVVAAAALSVPRARVLDALSLGEETARSLGVRTHRQGLLLITAMTLATAVAVAQAGLIAFIGLAAPHLVRRIVVGAHRAQLVLASLCGAALLTAADVVARSAWAPRELPVGLITALLGGTYLLVLLHRRSHRTEFLS